MKDWKSWIPLGWASALLGVSIGDSFVGELWLSVAFVLFGYTVIFIGVDMLRSIVEKEDSE